MHHVAFQISLHFASDTTYNQQAYTYHQQSADEQNNIGYQ